MVFIFIHDLYFYLCEVFCVSEIETLAVIPARYASTRLPAKPLCKLRGRELVLRVLDGVASSESVSRVIVATDDERIVSAVEAAGGEAMMTPSDLLTGGDRVAYVARRVPSKFVLNVQGDDPMVCAAHIDPMLERLRADEGAELCVLVKRIDDPDEIARDSIVKAVFALDGTALYFSRAAVPYPRSGHPAYFKHIGPYAWRRDALLAFAELPQGLLERAESLEMLRMLEHGRRMICVETEVDCIEIDTPEDVERYERWYDMQAARS